MKKCNKHLANIVKELAKRGVSFQFVAEHSGYSIIGHEWDIVCHKKSLGHIFGLLEACGQLVFKHTDNEEIGYLTERGAMRLFDQMDDRFKCSVIYDGKLNEIAELAYMLAKRGIEFNFDTMPETPLSHEDVYEGYHIIVKNGCVRLWDAVCHNFSYGGKCGLLEVMGAIVPKTEEEDVVGFLSAQEVIELLR